MTHRPEKLRRRSIRLQGYDYTQAGAYFITICSKDRACLFGDLTEGVMRLDQIGHIVRECWLAIPEYFPHVLLDEFVVMPNHVHGIIVIVAPHVGATHASPLLPNDDAPHMLVRTATSIGCIHCLSDRSNPPLPNGSTNTAARPARGFGNEIILITSSATTNR
jgi:putative transposase